MKLSMYSTGSLSTMNAMSKSRVSLMTGRETGGEFMYGTRLMYLADELKRSYILCKS